MSAPTITLHTADGLALGYDRDGFAIVCRAGEHPELAIEGIDYADGWHLGRYGFDKSWIDPHGNARRFEEE